MRVQVVTIGGGWVDLNKSDALGGGNPVKAEILDSHSERYDSGDVIKIHSGARVEYVTAGQLDEYVDIDVTAIESYWGDGYEVTDSTGTLKFINIREIDPTMSNDEQADNDDMPVTAQLWSVVEELQNIRQQNEINRREERNLRTAIANLDAVRKSVQAEQGDD